MEHLEIFGQLRIFGLFKDILEKLKLLKKVCLLGASKDFLDFKEKLGLLKLPYLFGTSMDFSGFWGYRQLFRASRDFWATKDFLTI